MTGDLAIVVACLLGGLTAALADVFPSQHKVHRVTPVKKYRVSVCKGPDCRGGGADAVFTALQAEVQRAGVQDSCTLYRGGCYGLCHLGPNMVIREDVGRPRDLFAREDFQLMGWPEEVHYEAMTAEQVPRVVNAHLRNDQPLAESERASSGDQPVSSKTPSQTSGGGVSR